MCKRLATSRLVLHKTGGACHQRGYGEYHVREERYVGRSSVGAYTKVSMKGYKVWRIFRECSKGEVRRIPLPRTRVKKGKR
jgi:hypothetical protein